MSGPLSNIRVVDLSRILAGPSCTQILGDLGADVIKVEKPGDGDDTRKWGPPYLKDADGRDTGESSYYLACNRNKRSVAVDITTTQGQEIIHGLLAQSDILIENFKVGGLKKFGLDYESVKVKHPHIIYASITGFGQTGPLSSEPGYDIMAQAIGGLMAATGEADGAPMKVGVALSDVMSGLYTAIGILAALHKRHETGTGEHIDIALLDCTIASMTNLAQYFLSTGKPAARYGNTHSTIVPYQAFEAADGWVIVAVGNDTQFARFAKLLGHGEWAEDARFALNRNRVIHRDVLVPMIATLMKLKSVVHWVRALQEIDVPAGPVNDMGQVFAMEQVKSRGMAVEMQHASAPAPIKLVGSPLKLTENPVEYKRAPPVCGADTENVLKDVLGMDTDTITSLQKQKIIT